MGIPTPTTWLIYDPAGHYLGQFRTFAPETAFCQYMSLRGERIVESEIIRATERVLDSKVLREIEESQMISYNGQEFVLRSRPGCH